jgi:hypothetical protein
MPTTEPNQLPRRQFLVGAAVASGVASGLFAADPPETPTNRLAILAAALTTGDAVTAENCFDKSLPGFGAIAGYIDALTAQTEVSCSIDIYSESGEDPARSLEVDWLMTLTTRTAETSSERRRQRVKVEMRFEPQKNRQEWRILNLAPLSILFPINIQ